jgi:hypothetical protein
MAVVTSYDVRYHVQDYQTYCGPATAMMLLNFLNGVSSSPLPERQLRRLIPTGGRSDATPDGIANAVSQNSSNKAITFSAKASTDFDTANDVIVRSLFDAGTPVPVEYYRGSHWVLVRGVLTDVVPARGSPYRLLGLFIHDPTIAVPEGDIAHGDGDRCGNEVYFGPLHEFVSIAEWRRHFGNFDGTFVSIEAKRVADAFVERDFGTQSSFTPYYAGEGSPQRQAMSGIAEYELDSKGPLKPWLSGAVAMTSPILVDGKDPSYIVTLSRSGAAIGYARVDGADGTFLGAYVTQPGKLHPIFTAEEMFEALNLELGFDGAMSRFRDQSATLSDPFWRPCREAVSPYFPLYELRLETPSGRRIKYVTTNKQRHDTLHFYDVP